MTTAEVETWRSLAAPPLAPAAWAEEHYRIPQRGNPEPGRYKFARTPYWREPTEAVGQDDPHDYVIVMKAPQVGASEWSRLCIGLWIDTTADPVLLVYPNEASCKEQLDERVGPTILASPRLSRWTTARARDFSLESIALAHMTIYGGWAGSPQALASRPVPRVVLDETDKYERGTREAPPDALAEKRTNAYRHRRKILAISTPTTKDGTIYRMWRMTRDRRHWHCACTACGQLVRWRWEDFRWDQRGRIDETDDAQALPLVDALEVGEARAWVECPGCGAEIHEQDRLPAIGAGEWVSEGHAPGERPRSRRVAYHIPSWISPFVPFAAVVAAYLRATLEDDLHDFQNAFLAEPAEHASGSVDASVFEERSDAPPYTIPEWATAVTAGADTQTRKGVPFWVYVVRAWGKGNRSRQIAYGKARTWADLIDATVDARFEWEGGVAPPQGARVLLIDSGGAVETVDGNTTHLVYERCRRDPARCVPVKGASRPQDKLIRASNVEYSPPGMPHAANVLLHTLDTERLKDILVALIRSTEPILWEESTLVTPDYVAQMTAEEKTRIRIGRKFQTKWVKTSKARNDLWDASVYALAGAIMLRADDRAEQKTERQQERREREKRGRPRRERVGGEQRRRFGARRTRERGRWIARRDDY